MILVCHMSCMDCSTIVILSWITNQTTCYLLLLWRSFDCDEQWVFSLIQVGHNAFIILTNWSCNLASVLVRSTGVTDLMKALSEFYPLSLLSSQSLLLKFNC